MRNFLHYQWIIVRRAWNDACAFAQRHLLGTIVATVAAFLALPAVSLLPQAEIMQEGALQFIYGLVGPIVLVFIAFMGFWVRAGSRIYAEAQQRIRELEQRLTPRISVSLPSGMG